jgi:probable rRNA maturation factor
LLHLAGYDHETDEGRMARRERLLRGKLKLPQGLIERSGSPTHRGKAAMDGARGTRGGLPKRDSGRRPSGAEARTLHAAKAKRV